MKKILQNISIVFFLSILNACGGSSESTPLQPTTFTISGTVTGLTGSGLVLQNNGQNDLSIAANGNFSFPTALDDGAVYDVTVLVQPAKPNQVCTITHSTGTVSGTNVSNLSVSCQLQLFLAGNDGTTGVELFVSDGTSSGTKLVKDINAMSADSNPSQMVTLNGIHYFAASTDIAGSQLWRSDGTFAGTEMVKQINSQGSSNILYLTAMSSMLYFSANDGIIGQELWTSDGTSAGTVLLKDINPGPGDGNPAILTPAGSTLYFLAEGQWNGAGGNLWQTDGSTTSPITALVNFGFGSGTPEFLTAVDSTLYFVANYGSGGQAIWKTDGTTVSLAAAITTGPPPSITYNQHRFAFVGSTLYYVSNLDRSSTTGFELWKTDSSVPYQQDGSNSSLVADINPGAASSYPDFLTVVGSTLYFVADDGSSGRELWKTDGTTTSQVADINPGAGSSDPTSLTAVGSTLYFVANDGVTGNELWKTDGTTTTQVADINAGAGSSNPHNLINEGGTLYFIANDGITGNELWKTDGTLAGTVQVVDLNPGAVDGVSAILE